MPHTPRDLALEQALRLMIQQKGPALTGMTVRPTQPLSINTSAANGVAAIGPLVGAIANGVRASDSAIDGELNRSTQRLYRCHDSATFA